MIDDVLGIPDQLRDALWRIESARLEASPSAGLFVCGMGGSAIGGDLAAAALGDRLTGPLLTRRGYSLPSWATPEWMVLCSSYSGETEETLACLEAAETLGAKRVVASIGGPLVDRARETAVPVVGLPGIFQPRAAVAYMLVVAAEVAWLAGVAPRLHTEIDAAAAFLTEQSETLQQQAREIAALVAGAVPVVYGADLTTPVARRWKTQVNENAKSLAWWSALPEADHNELLGWAGAAGDERPAAIFLEDRDQHPRIARRFELTAATLKSNAAAVVRVETAGETRLERLLWAVMLGDLVSLELSRQRGVDPDTVEPIERFKEEMG
ncbi:MAG TPA: bifunctional phosphoglucose/phosphomannose isomerase [Solirubrobacterales bacterium]|jgi:glucose/mannose-6-phosphate isomerase|nr:bifunctional phosphoglucose/phosphomannose isomerase [Solirubrobacterales bacterium]